MILVTGAGGHVGREIVKKAVGRGMKIRCFDRIPFDFKGAETITGDITCIEDVKEAVQGIDTVMFVLGLKRQTKEVTHEMVEHGGMQNVIIAAKEVGVKHIMYISALGVSPDAKASSLIAKGNAEKTLISSGIDYTIFRPSGYFVDFAEHFAPKIKQTGKFSLIGEGLTKIQPLAPSDLAEAFIQSIDNPAVKNRIFKISGPEVFTLAETVFLTAKVVGCPVKVTKLPFGLMNMIFSFMAFVTGKRGLKDFLYRMSRDSVCSEEETREIKEVFHLEFQKLEPWLRAELEKTG
jgi:NADH dehydrogenase